MNRLHRSILARLRESIVADMDVDNSVLDNLKTYYILKDDDLNRIERGESREKKAEILLDILPERGPHAFDAFKQALRHHYDWLSSAMENLLIPNDTEARDTAVTRTPTLPPISPLTVHRENKIEQLKTALRELNHGGYVVLHGMKGFGKSCLTASTLKDTVLVKNLFDQQIYWIKFGNKNPVEEEILIQLNILYHLIKNDSYQSNNNNDADLLKSDIKKLLKQHFNTDPNQNALLILDDVWDASIIETFDFNCKTLVITTNVDLLGDRHKEVVQMQKGFTEHESLGLFAKVLNIEIADLPQEAKDIHYECNGMPILIAMFAAQFQEYKEEMRTTQHRWQYYLKSLRSKDTTNKVIEKFLAKQEAIFDMCIDRLPEAAKARYINLAIFSEDVNITSKTLEILWNEKSHLVDEQMSDFCHKSLAAREWNPHLKAYIYGIHDLLVCHLRNKLGAGELKRMHKEFIEKYRSHCNGDLSKLPKDNYSFSYIGHHLEEAEMFDEFRKLYLDVNFIGAKIQNSGLNDLLIDLQKYRKYITNNDEDAENKVDDLEMFLKAQVKILAEHRRRECLDLVQIGINHNLRAYFYETCKSLAESQPVHLYLTHEKQYPIEELNNEEEVPTQLSTVNFTDNPDQILLGSYHGDVILWDTMTRRQTAYCGHEKSKIVKVIVAESGDFFLALNDQGVIKRFVLNHDEDEDSLAQDAEHLRSPREKQFSWSGIYKSPKDTSVTTYDMMDESRTDITDMALCDNDKKLAACTSKGLFRVWDINGEILCTGYTKGHSAHAIAFAKKDTLLFFVDAEERVVPVYSLSNSGVYEYSSIYRPGRATEQALKQLRGHRVIYFRQIDEVARWIRILLVTDIEAVVISGLITEQNHITNPSTRHHVAIDLDLNPSMKFTAATMTHDRQYIVIANSEGLIKVWGIDNNVDLHAVYPGKAISLDTYHFHFSNSHGIIGGINELTHRWLFKFEDQPTLPQSVRTPKFDAIMRPLDQSDIVVQVMDKKIGVFEGHTLIAETDVIDGDIIDLSLCQDDDHILYVIKKGHRENLIHEIKLFNYSTKISKLLTRLHEYKAPIKFLRINNLNVIVWKEGENLKTVIPEKNVYKVMSEIKGTGNVINLHVIQNKYVITVADNGKMIIWEVITTSNVWVKICDWPGGRAHNVCYSALNSQESMLSLLKSHGEMTLYTIEANPTERNKLVITEYVKQSYLKKPTCCSFSPDEKFLAVGMDNGIVEIYDVFTNRRYGELNLHCYPVLQLHWAPASIGLPILLSVNCEDIAWWNISLLDEKKLNRRSRTGLPRSMTTPTFGMSPRGSMRMPASQSADLSTLSAALEKINNGEHDEEIEKVKQFWGSKIPKDRPALLRLIQLPPSCRPKVCVSEDFKKFLLVDVHGSINTYKLFGL